MRSKSSGKASYSLSTPLLIKKKCPMIPSNCKGKEEKKEGQVGNSSHTLCTVHIQTPPGLYTQVSKMLASDFPKRSPHSYFIVSDPFLSFLSINAHAQICLKVPLSASVGSYQLALTFSSEMK